MVYNSLLDTCISGNHLRDVLLASPAPRSVVDRTTEEVFLQGRDTTEEMRHEGERYVSSERARVRTFDLQVGGRAVASSCARTLFPEEATVGSVRSLCVCIP